MNDFERFENKSLKLIQAKSITSFSKLYKALKISKTKFYNLGLNKSEKIIAAISDGEPKEAETKKTILEAPKTVQMRSFSEIQAKLFIYKAFKTKNYDRLTESAKLLIDRQIGILEWVLKINKEEQA